MLMNSPFIVNSCTFSPEKAKDQQNQKLSTNSGGGGSCDDTDMNISVDHTVYLNMAI